MQINFDATKTEIKAEDEVFDLDRKLFEAELEMLVQGENCDLAKNNIHKKKLTQEVVDVEKIGKEWCSKMRP